MSIAYRFAKLVQAYCKVTWPEGKPGDMESTMAEHFAGDYGASYASLKYVDQLDECNARLGLESGKGIWGRYRFKDGSWAALTCAGPLAVCDENGLRFP